MRWDGQGVRVDDGALPGLQRLGFVHSVRTPQFDGITCTARSGSLASRPLRSWSSMPWTSDSAGAELARPAAAPTDADRKVLQGLIKRDGGFVREGYDMELDEMRAGTVA
mgnify:CR=1 FL=1